MIKMENVCKKFSKKVVLENINMTIEKGEIISIIGKNGSGKTTIVKLLTGLLTQDSGQIFYNNKNLKNFGSEFYSNIGVMLEGNRNMYWYLTGKENIEYFGGLYKMSKKEINRITMPLVELFDLSNDINKPVGEYSRGMKQKLSLILSLINDPEIIFLDEPTLGLDIFSKRFLVQKIKELAQKLGKTIVITSHEFKIVEEISDRIFLVNDKKLIVIENVENFIKLESSMRKSYNITFINDGNQEISFESKFTVENIRKEDGRVEMKMTVNCNSDLNNMLSYLLDKKATIEKVEYNGISLEDIMKEVLQSDDI